MISSQAPKAIRIGIEVDTVDMSDLSPRENVYYLQMRTTCSKSIYPHGASLGIVQILPEEEITCRIARNSPAENPAWSKEVLYWAIDTLVDQPDLSVEGDKDPTIIEWDNIVEH